ncbi:MAG TPA: peroxiredoxin [Candidatus Nanoarchaeia archaeon]|nr:peroxiredoxin [Candidatus Nanoarchaeia archaeon]
MAKVRENAPEFKLKGILNEQIRDYSISEYKGKWTVLYFYPLDFTFVCPTEVVEFSKRYDEFSKLNAEVLGVSVDSVHSHKEWIKQIGGLKHPLLSDFNKEVSKRYDVLLEPEGIALRAVFIINPEGIIKYHLVHDLAVGRSVEEVLRVLKALQTGELCPVGWTPGKQTLGKA